ncbi:MAG: YgcG family protein, partial [Comamonadaceae bacterium]
MLIHWAHRALLLIALALGAGTAPAQAPLPVPPLTARVIDQTGTLDAVQAKGLEDKLAALEQSKGTQLVVLMVPTTQPEDIASYANRVGNAWKIGRKDVGDGVLLIVAKDDRKVRIEVAKTLEGAIPDLAAKQVIDTAITPNFRSGNYAAGLQAAADQLIARINGEALPAPETTRGGGDGDGGFDWFNIAILAFFAVPIGVRVLNNMFGRKFGALLASAGVGTVILLVTTSMLLAAIGALIALLFAFFAGGAGSGRSGGGVPWI